MDEYTVVKLIRIESGAALVEYTIYGDVFRSIIPDELIKGDSVYTEELLAGVPYGVDWDGEVPGIEVEGISQALHRKGIWTWDDLAERPLEIRRAITAIAEGAIQEVMIKLSLM